MVIIAKSKKVAMCKVNKSNAEKTGKTHHRCNEKRFVIK